MIVGMTADFTLDRFLDMPRVAGLALSPDGSRLVTTVARRGPKRFVTALWELDPSGAQPPRRLTRSAPGESGAAFLPDGSVLFTSTRPDPDAAEDAPEDEETAGLWLLPAAGGEAWLAAAPPGGVQAVAVARDAGSVVLLSAVHPDAEDWAADRARAKARTDVGVSARLFEDYPIRHWDDYLGPRHGRLTVAVGPVSAGEDRLALTELTPHPGRALHGVQVDVTPDGRSVVAGWRRETADPTVLAVDLVQIDAATGARRVLRADGAQYGGVACSPDGRWVACVRDGVGTPEGPGDRTLVVVDLTTGEHRDLAVGLDRRPNRPVWTPDSAAVVFTADDRGHTLPFRVEVATDAVTRLATHGAYESVCVAPDGAAVYALRSAVDRPPQAVVLDARAPEQEPRALPTPGADTIVPATVHRLETIAADGTSVPSWLVLPPGATATTPAPLVVWVHGGPVASWTGWHWRWNPHVLVGRGYAVLMPDPALSTGYGHASIARGWGRWGAEPYTDLLAAVDGACDRADIDHDRTALMGGSFGGYMANWVAGHTDRFACIVTHASLWDLGQFHGSTDLGVWWEREFGDPYTDPTRYAEHSPAGHVDRIRTPMLVIHGDRDYRVPVGEALKLWTDLSRHGVEAKFLSFPDEHHWILKPANVQLWYETTLAFLDHHVRGRPWRRPDLL